MNKASILAFSLVALILRFLSMQGELWLDEVWAITTVLSKSSIQDIFNFTTFDGHASLYSLFYRLIGSTLPEITKSWWLYRLPSFIASLGSLWLFVKIADKRSSFFIFFLVSFSFLLNLYGTEARGYSLCILLFTELLPVKSILTKAKTCDRTALFHSSKLFYRLSISPLCRYFLWLSSTMVTL